MLFFIVLSFFAIVSCLIAREPSSNFRIRPGPFLLNAALCAYFLLLASYIFLALVPVASVTSLFDFQLTTVRDYTLFSLWLLVCAITSTLFSTILRLQHCRRRGYHSFWFSKKQSHVLRTALACFSLLFLCSFSLKTYTETHLIISEVCAENDTFIYDENLKAGDYVELYNPTSFSVKLDDLYLSDDLLQQPKSLKGYVVPARGYCLIWTSKGDSPFGIRAGDDSLYLTSGTEKVIDSITLPTLQKGQVYARNAETAQWQIQSPTPLAENDPNVHLIDSPSFSAESGFYEEEFLLTLSAEEGHKIYYTLDSSTPDENSQLYTGPISVKNVSDQPDVYRAMQKVTKDWLTDAPYDPEGTVDKAFVIRAIAVDQFGNRSSVATKSYFVDMPKYQNRYVLSLVSEPDDLFGDNGIYASGKEYDDWYTRGQEGPAPLANFEKRGKAYEVPTTVALFHNDLLMSQDAGLRIQGRASRGSALKRFMVNARKIYSESKYFSYDIFGEPIDSFFTRREFEDAFLSHLVMDYGIGGLDAIPATVFLNGEYWYTAYIRERYTENYFAQKYQVSEDTVTVSSEVPDELYDFLDTHDLSKDADYDGFDEIFDIENYTSYIAASIYLCNMDSYFDQNVRLWKAEDNGTSPYGDGRWRYLIYDIDCIGWYRRFEEGTGAYSVNSFTQPMGYDQITTYRDSPIYSSLKQNSRFRKDFALTFMDMANTSFSKKYVSALLEEWGSDISRNNGFFEKRFDYIVPAMAQDLELQGTLETITLSSANPSAGELKINKVVPVLDNGTWTGSYYTDYPITISAQPSQGYEFVAWHHGEERYFDSTLEVSLEPGGNLWEAEFRKIGE